MCPYISARTSISRHIPELLHKFMVSVGYQRERQLILFDELAVRRFGIDADTDHLHTGIPECAVVVA